MNGKGPEDARAPAVPPPLEWKFSQVFGERAAGEEVQEVDIISAIEFDKSGDHLATGDRGGRVVLFERTDVRDHGCRRDLESLDYPISRHPEFRYKTEFQSHEPEVQEKKVKRISKMNLDPSQAAANGSIASSSTASPRVCLPNGGCSYNYMSNDFSFPPGGFPSLRLPAVVASQETSLVARCRRIYAHAHDYHINSISNNSDGETFISADDLRINLWNLEISNQSFNIVDVKPANMEDLTEVITSAEFHPNRCNTLAYSSSKGSIRLIDLRQSALCDNHSQLFEEAPGSRSFFTEIIASISDIKFGQDGRHILSRDYMTLKLWDINMDSGPVATFQVHEYLRPQLCDLYESDSIFDKFECCLSGDGLRVATGSYSNLFRVFGCVAGSTEAATLEASKNPMRRQGQNPARPARSLSSLTRVVRRGAETSGIDANGNSYDFTTKLLHLAWHPTENSIACAAANSLYMYYA
ncbi:serine/threonine protein phosphatase 2A 55 kDa regulatory subunit B beta isoform-like isoform X3 [Phoenix dactylifera]|uniref:Serine/threonine-protein phosphatase 2A 55 kDa regulatory subunit B n=1 Tax=Phoenix dactylifera TaxID=42345 RepID=A0A8B9APT4_PHODC|nr:serine/threonine protein phosphatase 2A 55 kDa regulatory subunit B beta isoform-like isoform X3 [Phoenix dactylifera]